MSKGSVCLLLFLAVPPGAWCGGPIHLKTRNLTAGSYPDAAALQTVGQGPGHLLVQFTNMPRAEDLWELRRRGARIIGAAPDGGITISVRQPVSLEGLDVQWAAPLLAVDKVSPLLSPGAAPVVVELHPDVSIRRGLQLLREMNVQILRHPDLASNHFLVSADPGQIAELAGFDEVAYIFPASNDLIQGNRVMACTGAAMANGPIGQYVTVGSGWGGAGPDGVVELDYVFSKISAKLPPASAQSEITRALAEWTKYANLRFVPGTANTAARTISILFAGGVHGDGYPFYPGSRILAHTFFPSPPNPEPLAGDMHLNDDQNWHIGTDIDLYTVALHEAGHALGLGHTDDPNAVMYPYYRFGAVLSGDDISGVRKLYGSRDTPLPPPAPLTVAILTPPTSALATSAASMALSGTAAGGTAPLLVTWASGQGSGTASGSSNWSIAAVPIAIGLNTITVRVTDSSGKSASSSIAVTRQAVVVTPVIPPSGPPSLTITSPSSSIVSTSQATITLSGTASASVSAVKWTNSTGPSGDATGTSSWTAAGIPLLVGTNTLTVRAYDSAGNFAWRALTVVRH